MEQDEVALTGSLVCDARTAKQVARAMSRSGLLRRRTLLSFGFGSFALIGLSISEGYPVIGVLAVVALLAFVVVTTYAGQLRQARVAFAEGTEVAAGTDAAAVRVRTGPADVTHALGSFDRADLVDGNLLLHLRGVNAHVVVVAGLLTDTELAAVQAGVGSPTTPQPYAAASAPVGADVESVDLARTDSVVAEPDAQPPGRTVVIDDEMSRSIERAALGYLLAPRRSLPLVAMLLVVLTGCGWALGHPWLGLGAAVLAALLVVLGSARQTSRSLRATLPVGSTITVRSEPGAFHVTGAQTTSSIELASVRHAERRGNAVLVRFGTNVLHVFPAAAFDEELLSRLLAAGLR